MGLQEKAKEVARIYKIIEEIDSHLSFLERSKNLVIYNYNYYIDSNNLDTTYHISLHSDLILKIKEFYEYKKENLLNRIAGLINNDRRKRTSN